VTDLSLFNVNCQASLVGKISQ